MVVVKVEKRKKAQTWAGKGIRSGRGVLARLIIDGIRNNQQPPEIQEQMVREFLDAAWFTAIEEAKTGDRVLLDSLLCMDEPVPADISQELRTLKGPNHRPPQWSSEDVVEAVQYAIATGHRMTRSDDKTVVPAFVEAARLLGYRPGTVVNKWKEVPKERKQEIRDEVKRLLKDWFRMPEEQRIELLNLQKALSEREEQKPPGGT